MDVPINQSWNPIKEKFCPDARFATLHEKMSEVWFPSAGAAGTEVELKASDPELESQRISLAFEN